MRHLKHRHQLGAKKEHRAAIMASLSASLFRHDRIKTTLGYARALRPFAEKIITVAKKSASTDDPAKKLHYRRLALAKVRDESAVHFLFADKVSKFTGRNGGYTRIYKLVKRINDAADMAIIELVEADDEGYKKSKTSAKKGGRKISNNGVEKNLAPTSGSNSGGSNSDDVSGTKPESNAETRVVEEKK